MSECEKLIRLSHRQADMLRRRADLFGRMQTAIEQGNQDGMRDACRAMEELEEESGRLPREVVEALQAACDRHDIPRDSATLGRLVRELDGEVEGELAAARRDLAGAIAAARRAAASVRRLASVAADWNAHVLDAVWSSVPGGQTYSASGELEDGEAGVLQGRWG